MAPYIFYRQLHKSGQTHGGLHVVGEHKEGAAAGHHASVQHYAVHYRGHGQLAHTGMKECAGKVAVGQGVGLLEEAVGFVGVRKVGARHNHVAALAGEFAEDVGRCRTCGHIGFMFDVLEVDSRYEARYVCAQLGRFSRIGLGPCLMCGTALGHDGAEFGAACFVKSLRLGEETEFVIRVTSEVLDGAAVIGTRFAKRLAVGRAFAFEILAFGGNDALAHYGASDYQYRFFGFGLSLLERSGNCHGVGAVDFNHAPVPCTVFCGIVLGVDSVYIGTELHTVGIVEHYKVAESEESGYTSGTLGNFFLYAAVADESVGLVGDSVAEAGHQEALGDCGAYSHGVTLSERT